MPDERDRAESGDEHLDEQAREQTGQQQVRLRIDEQNLTTSYANAFRTHGVAAEAGLKRGAGKAHS